MRKAKARSLIVLALGAVSSGAFAQDSGDVTVRSTGRLQPFLVEGYPEEALARREQGEARFVALVGEDGRPEECRVVQSSGFEGLDVLTCRLLTRFAKYDVRSGPAHPKQVYGSVSWRLPTGVAAAQPASMVEGGALANIRCQTVHEAQWRLSGQRVCLSKEKWDRIAGESDRGGVIPALPPIRSR